MSHSFCVIDLYCLPKTHGGETCLNWSLFSLFCKSHLHSCCFKYLSAHRLYIHPQLKIIPYKNAAHFFFFLMPQSKTIRGNSLQCFIGMLFITRVHTRGLTKHSFWFLFFPINVCLFNLLSLDLMHTFTVSGVFVDGYILRCMTHGWNNIDRQSWKALRN